MATVGVFPQTLYAIAPFCLEQLVEIDEYRRAVILSRLYGERLARSYFNSESHHGFIDRSNLFDIQRPIR